jgi:cell wall-associated NlpC family hydrolase
MANNAVNAAAAANQGDTTYTYQDSSKWPVGYKCNEFVYDMGEAAGIDMPMINGVPIKAYQWANGVDAVYAAGFVRVSDPQPGDIIASTFGTDGHVGIVVGPQLTVSAASTSVLDGVVQNNWGYRGILDLPTDLKTYWRFTGVASPPPINWGK